ncbi:DUF4234 domain-containing protein [Amycolatopsis cihanbeyliensis]|uniref:Uncharacterized protein DUF4234 n=1 Tax=Amycolatopsis cihanbeyliensis TaxID=1128664 RepID=A0A542DIJ4_AMYCI|nr:DUF4234 domain-containing protein [Amycolatopsis cihanbeyliensis]TQJ02922.1 uncharacterized protein DUF4234 [Amycolatopsis cihanbeyliensis]
MSQNPYEQPAQPMPPDGGLPQAPMPGPTGPAHQEPVASGIAMKQRHPVTVWLLWPLITLGIYHLVWYYKIHKEMAEFDRRRAVPVAGPMLVLLLLGWTVIAPLVSYYNCGNRIRNAQRAAGLHASCSPGIGTLLMIVFGLGILYYQIELNKIASSYGVPEGQQVPLWV